MRNYLLGNWFDSGATDEWSEPTRHEFWRNAASDSELLW